MVCVYKLLFSEKQAILKLSVAELSDEIAKSLAKKLDRKEFKAIAAKDNTRAALPQRKVQSENCIVYIEYITCIMYPTYAIECGST